MNPQALRACWGLYKSPERRDTYIAAFVAAVVLGPVAIGLWRRFR